MTDSSPPPQFVALNPSDPPRYNGGIKCDMLIGPCACGAWHLSDGTSPTHHAPSIELPEPKWKTNAPDSRILFATDGKEAVVVIDHVGDAAYYIVHELRDSFVTCELKPWKSPGLWIWEGYIKGWWCNDDYDESFIGEVRPLDEDEARSLREDDDIWDRSLWEEK